MLEDLVAPSYDGENEESSQDRRQLHTARKAAGTQTKACVHTAHPCWGPSQPPLTMRV